VMQ